MLKVWKFPIVIDDYQSIAMPSGARLLHIDLQNGTPCIWALVDPHASIVKRKLRIAGTGHPIDPIETRNHVGTVQMLGGNLIWHVFDLGEVA